jgi:hypothetical protein
VVDDPLDILNSTCTALVQFFTRADAARNRRADEAGPALLRVLRDLWRNCGPEAMRDLEDGCERLLFVTPDVVLAKTGGKGTPRNDRGDRGGYRRGPRAGGNYGNRNEGNDRTRDDGYGNARGAYETYEPAPARSFAPAHQRQTVAPSTDHMDRCVHCNGEHLSQRCYTKFPNLRPSR